MDLPAGGVDGAIVLRCRVHTIFTANLRTKRQPLGARCACNRKILPFRQFRDLRSHRSGHHSTQSLAKYGPKITQSRRNTKTNSNSSWRHRNGADLVPCMPIPSTTAECSLWHLQLLHRRIRPSLRLAESLHRSTKLSLLHRIHRAANNRLNFRYRNVRGQPRWLTKFHFCFDNFDIASGPADAACARFDGISCDHFAKGTNDPRVCDWN